MSLLPNWRSRVPVSPTVDHAVSGLESLESRAHHPLALSNTYAFYKRGWRGVNIEATPGSMEPFRKYRPEDIDLEIGVGPRKERLPFTIFSDPALNGFVDESTVRAHQARGITVRRVVEIDCFPVDEVLHTHLDGQSLWIIPMFRMRTR